MVAIRNVNMRSRNGHFRPLILKLMMTIMPCATCYFSFMFHEQAGGHISIGDMFFYCTMKLPDSLHCIRRAIKDLKSSFLTFIRVMVCSFIKYFSCSFLKKLYPSSQLCPHSYDKLRIDPRTPNCQLLNTHDDYSVMSKLPKEKTSVVTILRYPVDRVFSTYEFSVEVASRFMIHPNLTSVVRMDKRIRRKKSSSTLEIWPWKYLVPWMREDLFARRDARKSKGPRHLVTSNSYDIKDMVMPLHKFINDPIVRDIVHNGATFQITGLSNNSYFPGAHKVRHCVLKHRDLGKYVLEVAKRKLDKMLYIGLTENHKESAAMFANIVGAQLINQHAVSGFGKDFKADDNDSGNNSLLPDNESNDQDNSTNQMLKNVSSSSDDEVPPENLAIHKLIDAYVPCIARARKSQAEKRAVSLKQISPVNFTKEARSRVPEALIHEIKSLNSLDVELYSYAEHIFKRQQANMQSLASSERLGSTISTTAYPILYKPSTWEVVVLSIAGLLLLLFVFFFVNSKRRMSKVKM